LSLAPLGSFSDRLLYLWIPFILDIGSGVFLGMFIAAMVGEFVRRDGSKTHPLLLIVGAARTAKPMGGISYGIYSH